MSFFSLWQFYTLYEQKFSNMRPLLSITFPQGFRKSKKFGHWTLGSGGKKKESESVTDKQTDGQTFRHFDKKKFKGQKAIQIKYGGKGREGHMYSTILCCKEYFVQISNCFFLYLPGTLESTLSQIIPLFRVTLSKESTVD